LSNLRRNIPEGVRDILFQECSSKNQVINTLRYIYISRGFFEVTTPTLEFYDVFHGETISFEQEKMYKLFDNLGRILVLRPDMTMPIGRIVATKLKEALYPLRICYSGNIFRMNETCNGKISEITQSGIEIIGSESSRVDAEVIITAIEALLAIGIKNFEIELGQAEFFKGIIEEIDMKEEEIENLRAFVENKNFSALKEFIEDKEHVLGEDNVEVLKKLPELFGGVEILDKARELTKSLRALSALDNIAEIYKKIDLVGLGSYISIDLGMVQNIHYYTGIIFRGYSREGLNTVISGGRYDDLIAQFGESKPAIGFAMNVDSVMSILEKQGENNEGTKKKFLLHYEEPFINDAHKLAVQLRNKGFTIELSLFEDKEKAIGYAEKNNIYKFIYILDKEKVSIMDMKNKALCNMSINKFIYGLEE